MILGIDEVGRGPWAGPLVIGAVCLNGATIDGLADSKKLTKKRREELNAEILSSGAAVGIGWVEASEIDEIGLSAALSLATKRAVRQVQESGVSFHEIIIDGTINFLRDTPLEPYVTTMKKADLLIPSVSAASIVAKVARDKFMAEQDEIYPGYQFAKHVGYGTAAHRVAIDTLGITPLHRLSFAPLAKYATVKKASDEFSPDQQVRPRHKILPKASPDSAELASLKQSSNRGGVFGKIFGTSHSASHAKSSSDLLKTTRQIGDASETAATNELIRRGHDIITRNWKTKYCEIDIISSKDGVLYFTEVKHRKTGDAGDGLAAITPKKLAQMKYAAEFYIHTQHLEKIDRRLLAIATTGSDDIVVVEVVDIS